MVYKTWIDKGLIQAHYLSDKYDLLLYRLLACDIQLGPMTPPQASYRREVVSSVASSGSLGIILKHRVCLFDTYAKYAT
jgi:hypothetical protein